jgi:hypothetical protein
LSGDFPGWLLFPESADRAQDRLRRDATLGRQLLGELATHSSGRVSDSDEQRVYLLGDDARTSAAGSASPPRLVASLKLAQATLGRILGEPVQHLRTDPETAASLAQGGA